MFAKTLFNRRDVIFILVSNDEIINIESKVCSFAIDILVDEDAGIGFTLLKIKVYKHCGNQLKPCTRGLF